MTGTRILLAEDHVAMRDRIVRLLQPDFDIVGVVDNGQALLEAAVAIQPDLVVVDITMPVLNGIEATQLLRDAASAAKVVFLTMHEDQDYVRAALAAGGIGYVVKSHLASDLTKAINEALCGRLFVSPSLLMSSQDEDDE